MTLGLVILTVAVAEVPGTDSDGGRTVRPRPLPCRRRPLDSRPVADDQIEGSSPDDRSDDEPLDPGDAVPAQEREETLRTSDGPPTTESSADLLARQFQGGDEEPVDDRGLHPDPVFRGDRLFRRPRLVRRPNHGRTPKDQRPGREPRESKEPQVPKGGYRVRRVRRLVRHVEPWSVLKVCLVLYLCVWGLLVIATKMLWSAADEAGTIAKIESFVEELFALESFEFDSAQIFRIFVLGGLVVVVGGIGITVVLTVLFNLISDLTGGVRFTMIEEETAVRQRRLRRGDVLVNPAEVPSGGPDPPPTGE